MELPGTSVTGISEVDVQAVDRRSMQSAASSQVAQKQ